MAGRPKLNTERDWTLLYKDAYQYIMFNDGDDDLTPIRYNLPPAPPLNTIPGYGMKPEDQFWDGRTALGAQKNQKYIVSCIEDKKGLRPKPPEKLIALNKKNISRLQKMKELEHNPFYSDCIQFIWDEWRRRKHGYWFYNFGRPTYITGPHYYYLQNWSIGGVRPLFKMRDRKWYLFERMCDEDEDSLGFNYPKHRREGATTRVSCLRFDIATRVPYAHVALQSKTEDDANFVTNIHVKEPWTHIPFWFEPVWNGDERSVRVINFTSPPGRMAEERDEADLRSRITYEDSGEKAYDGQRITLLHNDECFGKGTGIRMFDGSVKPVEQIEVGDLVMGPDGSQRTVGRTQTGEDELYEVVPNKFTRFICNGNHKLSTRNIDNVIIDISINDYINSTNTLLLYNNKNEVDGFTVNPIGRGTYYGFTLIEDNYFLLEDFTVQKNCGKIDGIDVYARWGIQQLCLKVGDTIVGKAINTSTVDEMSRLGAMSFKKLCTDSNYHKRNANGRTSTGLYTLFISAKDGYEGIDKATGLPLTDKYGITNQELAERIILNERDEFRNKGDLTLWVQHTRQLPLKYKDCFKYTSKICNFNLVHIEEQLDKFRHGNEFVQTGDFQWKDGVVDGTVEFKPSKAGKFKVSLLFPNTQHSNKYYILDGKKFPENVFRFCAGGDPFKFKNTKYGKKSMGAGAVFYKRDLTVDGKDKPIDQWRSERFICTYSNRPSSDTLYAEDMLMMCVYYGCEMHSENNVPMLIEHFARRGYNGYLYFNTNHRGRPDVNAGSHTGEQMKEDIFRAWHAYIEKNGLREVHTELLEQCKEIEDDMGDYDLFVAGGYALITARQMMDSPPETPTEDAEEYVDWATYDYSTDSTDRNYYFN